MYNEGLAVTLLGAEGTFSEKKGLVYVPFGTEYKIRLKNTLDIPIVADILIDGEPAFNRSIYVRGRQTIVLEGDEDNYAFKFIKRTDKIKRHRGPKRNDSIVKIIFRKEIIPSMKYIGPWIVFDPWNNDQPSLRRDPWYQPNITFDVSNNKIEATYTANTSEEGKGITTKGQEVDQHFVNVDSGVLSMDEYEVVLKLTGLYSDLEKVTKVKPTRKKIQCNVCGTHQKASHLYCCECGTNLKSVA